MISIQLKRMRPTTTFCTRSKLFKPPPYRTCISCSRKISSIWTSPLTPLSNRRSHPCNRPTPLKHNSHSRAIYSTLIIFFALLRQPHSSPSAPISENNPLLISSIKRLLIGSIFAGFIISNSILPTTIPLITIPLHLKLTALIVTTLGFMLALEINLNSQNIPTPQAPLNSLLS
eukprot:bmy_17791T0